MLKLLQHFSLLQLTSIKTATFLHFKLKTITFTIVNKMKFIFNVACIAESVQRIFTRNLQYVMEECLI